jgi:hypothetical protein
MEEKETETADLERSCQGVSPSDEPCDYPATVHCATCRRWFCDAHAEDEEWHPCMPPPGEGGRRGIGHRDPALKPFLFRAVSEVPGDVQRCRELEPCEKGSENDSGAG